MTPTATQNATHFLGVDKARLRPGGRNRVRDKRRVGHGVFLQVLVVDKLFASPNRILSEVRTF
jgi:hypothetical protein